MKLDFHALKITDIVKNTVSYQKLNSNSILPKKTEASFIYYGVDCFVLLCQGVYINAS